MSRGKHLSLEEARRTGQLGRFTKEHPSIGDEQEFDALLDAIAQNKPPKARRKPKPRNSKVGGKT